MISTTPMVRPREMRDAHMTERVLELGLAVEAAGEARVLASVVHDGGLARLRHPARDALAHPDRKVETSLAFSPSASSKVSSWVSSSTIRMDHASEGMSCWIFAMISSMSLRGSRIELAVLHDVREDRQALGGPFPAPRRHVGGRRGRDAAT
jgi:hypothetical protein